MIDPEAIALALKLVEAGRFGDAKLRLLSIEANIEDWPEDILGFQACRSLARCYRVEHNFAAARAAGQRALAIAESLGQGQWAAVALEGLALIEMEDDRIRDAAEYFRATAALEGNLGNLDGRAAALSNWANMLINRDLEGAEPLLRDALRQLEPGDWYYPAVADNLAGELQRQARYSEAIEYSDESVKGFLADGRQHDAVLALRTLARILAHADRIPESAQAFERAHDLLRDLRNGEVDEAHYAKYPERVRAIEAHTYDILKDSDSPGFMIGVVALAGEMAMKQGMEQLEAGHSFEAINSLIESRQAWERLQAFQQLVSVNYHLALAYTEIGDIDKALPLLFGAQALAHELGDAWRETMALSLLARLSDRLPGHDGLDYILQARALTRCVRRQLGLPPDADVPLDGGVEASLAATICADAQAYDLAERYFDETLTVARDVSDKLGYHFVYRLFNYYRMLTRAGRLEQAAKVLAELTEFAARAPADPRIDQVVARAKTTNGFAEGERTQEILDGLLEECRAYEQMRGQARGLDDLQGFAEAVRPPYDAAAEVALALGNTRLMLHLLERGKARTLVETLGKAAGRQEVGDLGSSDVPAIGDAVGVALFVFGPKIAVLALDGSTGELTCTTVDDEGDEDRSLAAAVSAFVDASDSERAHGAGADALDAVLAHATFRRLAEAVSTSVSRGRVAWLTPHRFLHHAPLQLLHLSDPSADGYSVVPSLSIATTLPDPRLAAGAADLVVCGDSRGDLPFARAEARLVAGQSSRVAVGGQCTGDWLRSALMPSTRILHIACHGRYDGGRPSRSGLLFAVPENDEGAGGASTQLMSLAEVAKLPLHGVTVVLSACSSAMETVRLGDETSGLVSAFLAAEASTVIAAQWPISDLSAMLFMTRFHEHLLQPPAPPDVLAALARAASDLQAMSAADLADRGFVLAERLLGLRATEEEAVTIAGRCLIYALSALGDEGSAKLAQEVMLSGLGQTAPPDKGLGTLRRLRPPQAGAGSTRPFASPRHWGAFKVVGRA